MGCCVGKSAEVQPTDGEGKKDDPVITPADKRKCRDVFWLLLFILFQIGMLCIGGFAFYYGDVNKIMYGIDSMGNICGADNNWNGTEGPNLVSRTQLYYIMPYQILDALHLPWAKTICVEKCPGADDFCDITNHTTVPCDTDAQFRCPYYMGAEYDLYGFLPDVTDPRDTQYFEALANTTKTRCEINEDAFGNATDLANDALSATATCGDVYQSTSKLVAPSGQLGPCYPVFAKTVSYMNRCFPDPQALLDLAVEVGDSVEVGGKSVSDIVGDEIGSNLQVYLTDLYRGAIIIIGCGMIGGCLLAVIWMVILRYFAGCMAWTAIVLVNLIMITGTLLCFQKSGLLGEAGAVGSYITSAIEDQGLSEELNPAEDSRKQWEIAAWVALVLTILMMLFTLLMCRRIKVAVACLKVASQAVGAMPSVLLFPLLPLMVEIIFLVYWLAVCALLYSSGEIVMKYRGDPPAEYFTTPPTDETPAPDTNDGNDIGETVDNTLSEVFLSVDEGFNVTDEQCYNDPNCAYAMTWKNSLQYLGLYHLFGLLWTLQFISGYGQVVLAGSIANFYWYSGDKSKMPTFPICKAMANATKALGSIALGSLIIAVIQFIRFILEYVDRKTKELQGGSAALKYLISCLKCCAWCLEKIMKFINRNAYIIVGVKGTNYCSSAIRAASLLIANVLRLAAVNTVGDFLIFLAKLTVVGACGVAAFFISGVQFFTDPVAHPDTYLSSPLVPIIGSVLCAAFVASLFFQVYEMAADTVLLCFCEDCETNGDPKYAPKLLMKAIGASPDTAEGDGK
uniref:Choline transporter-like protein n=1 Tax=Tetraselmis chuii TaxID=63592 RepID=A0A7S1SUR8_9CHLO|mmetsp:Transcript_26692/g.47504  ORF Transcript_26692/g.47504 Transcript_26692/m.47504 type:complete len:793 (+) Transcript_26692:107-2485(+)